MTGLVFMPEALDANRGGRLGFDQRRALEAAVKRNAGGVLGGALRLVQPLAKDVRADRVESIVGAVIKETGTDLIYVLTSVFTGTRRVLTPTSYRIWLANHEFGNREFRSAQDIYEFAPMAGVVRLFYLPRSRWAVNLERLPEVDGRPVRAEGAVGRPMEPGAGSPLTGTWWVAGGFVVMHRHRTAALGGALTSRYSVPARLRTVSVG